MFCLLEGGEDGSCVSCVRSEYSSPRLRFVLLPLSAPTNESCVPFTDISEGAGTSLEKKNEQVERKNQGTNKKNNCAISVIPGGNPAIPQCVTQSYLLTQNLVLWALVPPPTPILLISFLLGPLQFQLNSSNGQQFSIVELSHGGSQGIP